MVTPEDITVVGLRARVVEIIDGDDPWKLPPGRREVMSLGAIDGTAHHQIGWRAGGVDCSAIARLEQI